MRVFKIACVSMIFGWMLGGSALAQAAASVKLSWSIPTTRENGKALGASELSGYELYYTTDNPAVSGTVKINGGATSTYTVQNLAAGDYHFAMSAIDASGLKSKLSAVANIRVAVSTALPSAPISVNATVASAISGLKIVRVNWVPPKTRTDGTPLVASDLSGYKVVLFNFFNSGIKTNIINDGSATAYSATNMQSGLYVVELTAIDKAGKQGASKYSYFSI